MLRQINFNSPLPKAAKGQEREDSFYGSSEEIEFNPMPNILHASWNAPHQTILDMHRRQALSENSRLLAEHCRKLSQLVIPEPPSAPIKKHSFYTPSISDEIYEQIKRYKRGFTPKPDLTDIDDWISRLENAHLGNGSRYTYGYGDSLSTDRNTLTYPLQPSGLNLSRAESKRILSDSQILIRPATQDADQIAKCLRSALNNTITVNEFRSIQEHFGIDKSGLKGEQIEQILQRLMLLYECPGKESFLRLFCCLLLSLTQEHFDNLAGSILHVTKSHTTTAYNRLLSLAIRMIKVELAENLIIQPHHLPQHLRGQSLKEFVPIHGATIVNTWDAPHVSVAQAFGCRVRLNFRLPVTVQRKDGQNIFSLTPLPAIQSNCNAEVIHPPRFLAVVTSCEKAIYLNRSRLHVNTKIGSQFIIRMAGDDAKARNSFYYSLDENFNLFDQISLTDFISKYNSLQHCIKVANGYNDFTCTLVVDVFLRESFFGGHIFSIADQFIDATKSILPPSQQHTLPPVLSPKAPIASQNLPVASIPRSNNNLLALPHKSTHNNQSHTYSPTKAEASHNVSEKVLTTQHHNIKFLKLHVVQHIKQMFKVDGIAQFRISLRDPYSLSRIKIPLRSNLCKHIQCFDHETGQFVNKPFNRHQNSKNIPEETWKCLVCNKIQPKQSFFIDPYFSEILNSVPVYIDEVTIDTETAAWSIYAGVFDPNSLHNSKQIEKNSDIISREISSCEQDDDENRLVESLNKKIKILGNEKNSIGLISKIDAEDIYISSDNDNLEGDPILGSIYHPIVIE